MSRKNRKAKNSATPSEEPKQGEKKKTVSVKFLIEQPQQASPTLRLGWCITDAAVKALRKRGIKYPYLLLVGSSFKSKDYENEEGRLLLPLDQAMEFVVFDKPGGHMLRAAIVWSAWEKYDVGVSAAERQTCHKDLSEAFITRVKGKPTTDLFCSGVCIMDNAVSNYCLGEEIETMVEQEICVDEKLFAKEPPRWLKSWVNWNRAHAPEDECQFRRRAIWAFTVQPFIWIIGALFFTVCRIIALLVCLLLGIRIASWMPLIRPYSYKMEHLWGGDDDCTCWWQTTKGNEWTREYYDWPVYQFLCIPIIWLCALPLLAIAIMLVVRANDISDFGFVWPALTVVVFLASFAAKRGGPIISQYFHSLRRNRRRAKRDLESQANATRAQQKEEAKRQRQQQALAEELDTLYAKRLLPISCGFSDVDSPTVDAFPPTHKTFHLRWWNLKAKVCRPFVR